MSVVVLGAGRIGGTIARDLAANPDISVTVADRDEAALAVAGSTPGVDIVSADLSDLEQVAGLAEGRDLVIDALPGFMGYKTLETVIRAGVDVVDIAFFSEDPFTLDKLAKQNGVVAIVDFGVVPGMGGALIGHVASTLDVVEDVVIYVGGLPEVRELPWEYKAVFSPIDVIEEYIRPARALENGKVVTFPALSDRELLEYPDVGVLEAFNTDGLRTLIQTIDSANMREKTLRYPGHAERMEVLRESGFFSTRPIEIDGRPVRPIDLTSRLLFPMWQLDEGEADLTVLKIQITGRRGGQQVRHVYDLLDRYDPETRTTSMARTTGYAATAAARLVLNGIYTHKGISPPEYVGRETGCIELILDELRDRGVIYHHSTETIE